MSPTRSRFAEFARRMTEVVDSESREESILKLGTTALAELVAVDDWLPETYAQASAERYQQFLLHCDPQERFSVVSFVWGPGQKTPVHDHCTWGLVGVLRGRERSQQYAFTDREQRSGFGPVGTSIVAGPGDVDAVSPEIGDIHVVENDDVDTVAISIHVYGGNIGKIPRHIYDTTGSSRDFISGYAPTPYTELWT